MVSEFQEIEFLLKHKEFFKNHICSEYPLTENFLVKYNHLLDWNSLSNNEKLPWSIEFIEKFIDYWNWDWLSGNEFLPWSDELIEKFATRWNWDHSEDFQRSCLTGNDSIKWSWKLILKYKNKFESNWLTFRYELLNDCPELLNQFKDYLWWEYISGDEYLNWSEDLIEKYQDYWNWEILSGNRSITWTKELKAKFNLLFNQKCYEEGNWEMFIHKKSDSKSTLIHGSSEDKNGKKFTPEEFDKVIKLYRIGYFSLDNRVPWSNDIIEKYKAEWDWEMLSINEDLPWSEELIDRYINKWDFGTEHEYEDGTKGSTLGLTYNKGLPWSLELIRKYKDRWNWLSLSYSENIPWTLEILEEFENKWEWEHMVWNENMWRKVFYPCLDEEVIGALLTIVNKKIYPF